MIEVRILVIFGVLFGRGYKRIFCDDGDVLWFVLGGGYTCIYIGRIELICIFKICEFYGLVLVV